MKKSIFLLFFTIFLASCIKREVVRLNVTKQKKLQCESPENKPRVTIWVHGTRLFTEKVLTNFFYSKKGLFKAENYDKKYHLRTISDCLSESNSSEFPNEHFYHFGWCGSLSVKLRKEAARRLSTSISELINFYKKEYGQEPYLTIVTHSHGGNVTLNLAKFKKDFNVDRLILLACPVQKETKDLISDPLFKEVYSFYSGLDLIQIIDPQGLQHKTKCKTESKAPLFSKRIFDDSDNLKQAKVKLDGRGILHSEFILTIFLKHLDRLVYELKKNKNKNILLSVWQSKNKMK